MGVDTIVLGLTQRSIERRGLVILVCVLASLLMAWQATRVTSEVGYAAYFGPEHPGVARMKSFLSEFDVGLFVLFAFTCDESALCERVDEPEALKFIGRMHAELSSLPNVRRMVSILNAPIVSGPFDIRTVARLGPAGSFELADDWPELVEQARTERFIVNTVISPDARAAGLIMEFQSLDSRDVRQLVHEILDRMPRFEQEFGGEIHLAGDPVWTVMSDDDLQRDSNTLTVLMFMVIIGVLFGIFRSAWLTALPLLAIGVLFVAVNGLIGLSGIPMTSILAALPPLVVVIAVTTAIHFLTAWVRSPGGGTRGDLPLAAGEVGGACFWASATTIGGFLSFLWSDLASFRHFGLMAASGVAISFVLTFSFLPALLSFRSERWGSFRLATLPDHVVDLAYHGVRKSPRFVLVVGLGLYALLATGVTQVYYHTDFGDQSFILRSVRFIEAHLRKPMTTELVLSIPQGKRVYDRESLQILERLERYFDSEPSTGYAWSFLDFVSEAYRVDRGTEPESFDVILSSARGLMPLVASQSRVAAFWSESEVDRENGGPITLDRARVSIDRSWLDDTTQSPYLERLRSFLRELNDEIGPGGYRVDLEGGLVLSDLAVHRIRATQLSSFASAFGVVLIALVVLLRRSPGLLVWACVLNVLPVISLLGLMGWTGIGVDPANSMVAAILLVIAVDDTIHIALRYRSERNEGQNPSEALQRTLHSVGQAVLITSLCLGLGFSVLMFSTWGGLVSFGLLASLGVFLALAADLVLLPAALLFRYRVRE